MTGETPRTASATTIKDDTMRQPTATRALLVEDDSARARRVTTMLKDTSAGFEVVRTHDVRRALEALERQRFDVILVAPVLPDAAGHDAVDALRILAGGTPLLSCTDELRVSEVDAALADARFEQATRDALRDARTQGTDVTVLQLHVPGWDTAVARADAAELARVTAAVGERLAGRLPAGDVLVDLGGGRHGVIAAELTHEADARGLALDLVQALERPLIVAGEPVALVARCGWVLAPSGAPTADVAVLRSAPDEAPSVVASPVTPAAPTALPARRAAGHLRAVAAVPVPALEPAALPAPGPRRGFPRRLRTAIAAGELVLHYQPIVRLGDDTIPVVEALVRWKLPTDDGTTRFLPPAEFIPLAEETGAIEEIGAFALHEACRQLREWDDLGLAPIRVAVNLSARELCSPALPARVADALAESGLPADRLELELTESMFADPEATAKMLRRLRALGVRVAIDDFGTGYSSLGYLTRFAVDVIKVDGAFIRRAADDHDAAEVVRAIVAIAHQLELEVVAEGVETTEQLHFVQGEHVDLVQGFLFCEPLPAEAAGTWLAWAEDVVAQEAPTVKQAGVMLARREKLVRGATLAVGSGLGALAVLPVRMPSASTCPPTGEGLVFCQVQHGWAPAATVFMVVVALVFAGVDLARRAPAMWRRFRDPKYREQRQARARRSVLPATSADPLLLAATWGVTAPPNTVAAALSAAVPPSVRAA